MPVCCIAMDGSFFIVVFVCFKLMSILVEYQRFDASGDFEDVYS